jgi:hypothetical protein
MGNPDETVLFPFDQPEFAWLDDIQSPNTNELLRGGSQVAEIAEELIRADLWYRQGDTAKAVDMVDKMYDFYNVSAVDVCVKLMRLGLIKTGESA